MPSESHLTEACRVRVTRVDFDAAAEVVATSPESTPPPGVSFVQVDVSAAFAGPGGLGSTGHYWYARAADGSTYASSTGCGGGSGTSFDVEAEVPAGGIVSGTHCFELPTSNVASLRLRVEGADRADTFFALR